jgi:cytochrome c553
MWATGRAGAKKILGRARVKHVICILAVALTSTLASAAEKPDWAFPVTEKEQPPARIDSGKVRTVPGSTLSITRAQADEMFDAPDWFPNTHPAMPKIVQYGNKDTQVRACGACHLPTGTGHDESAYVAGLPTAYFIRQMADWKNGDRKYGGTMVAMAKVITDAEIKEAADYFASVKPRAWIRVVETDTVPKSFVGPGNKRLAHPAGGTEPIANRIIEIPEDEETVVYRDPSSGFVAYVPSGSIAKGKELATTGGGGKTIACTICHGANLQGLGDVPGIAGRHPNYIVRQMWNIQNGDRTGNSAALMKAVVAKLSNDDMLAIAAYTASLTP